MCERLDKNWPLRVLPTGAEQATYLAAKHQSPEDQNPRDLSRVAVNAANTARSDASKRA
jgi:hypothetical protein